jgi:hypothetical protein
MRIPRILLAPTFAACLCVAAHAQNEPVPRRDLSGIWQAMGGVQALGAQAMPSDGNPAHEPPYSPYGVELESKNRPTRGIHEIAPTTENDPSHGCDPLGFPRENLFELRTVQILQTPVKTVLLYTFGKVYRIIWTDGRALPADPDPHWFGYSVGRWTDDFHFVVETNGTDPRTWIDNAGRPHSDELRAQETFHRVDRDHLELSMTLDDPKVYTRPWTAIDKLRFTRRPPNTEIPEMLCSPSELQIYNRLSAPGAKAK